MEINYPPAIYAPEMLMVVKIGIKSFGTAGAFNYKCQANPLKCQERSIDRV
jgi:hypothetical protein